MPRPLSIQAFAWMREQSGRYFDPEMVEVRLRSRAEVLPVAARFRDGGAPPAATMN